MTNEELMYAKERNLKVRVENHDYAFEGWILTIFCKYNAPEKIRCVVESGEGLCLIQSAKNLEFAKMSDYVLAHVK